MEEEFYLAVMACNDDWQVAGRRKGAARRGKQASNPKLDSNQESDCKPDKQKIINAMNELRGENFWMEWKDLLSERLLSSASGSSEQNGDVSLQHCVCYGLGHFASCVSARYQLAMLLLLLETLQIPVGSCCVYDPVFSEIECDALKELGFTVLTENEVHHTFIDIKRHLFCCQFLRIIFHTGGKASGLSTHPVLPDALWEGSV